MKTTRIPQILGLCLATLAIASLQPTSAQAVPVPAPNNPQAPFETKTTVENGIVWEKTDVSVKAKADAGEIDFLVKGINASGKPIKIAHVHRTCGCQNLFVSKVDLAPGEPVEISGKITFPPNSGSQTKPFQVFTDHGKPATITINIETPQKVKISTTGLSWKQGEVTPQTVTVDMEAADTITEAKLIGTGFTMTEKRDANKLTLTIIPTATATKAAIRLQQKDSPRPMYVALSHGADIPAQTGAIDNPNTPPAPPQLVPKHPGVAMPPTQPTAAPGTRDTQIQEARMLLKLAMEKLEAASR